MNRVTPWLIIFNLAFFGGLAWRADHIRLAQQSPNQTGFTVADQAKDGAVLDAITTSAGPVILQPPLALWSK